LSSALLAAAVLVAPTSPEAFLQVLCDTAGKAGGDLYWSRTAAAEVSPALSSRDSIGSFFSGASDLSVDPGNPVLLESDQATYSYRVSFPEAAWSWTGPDGRVHRARGSTVVISSGALFQWVSLPPLQGSSVSVGPKDRIVAGFMMTVLTLLLGAFALWWVKRRWGTSEGG
jgi:hypothetical protein